ncbi:uncharacterized protein LOC103721000 isoform X2 [Phoenix dactylifera]|uniref:Large ribosomal subunit protein mL45 n=1 Tax=Phoenix dactylifera TaxID=42345 RepID=A0A8B9ARZ5_PHODC|nr:uncharacterized protein LOC103721000 isoform X2 [Phoenix dactylifera]
MALARFSLIRRFNGASQRLLLPSISRCSPSYMNSGTEEFGRRSIMTSSCDISGILGWNSRDSIMLCSMKVSDLTVYSNGTRPMSTMKAPAGARQVALKVTMLSPGFVYEPYKLREPIPFWKRWFTPSGWRRTKEDIILEMKNAYAISRLRKVTGYSKKLFYQHAIRLYKETLKNELKRRESIWSFVYWELVEPVVSIRTLRARMIALDKNDLDKAFIQLTIEFVTKQKFEAYDSKGAVVSGDKTKEVLVKDIWVFERSLFHPGADWRLCARLSV